LPYNAPVYTFVETKLFTRLIDEYLSDDEYAALQLSLAVNPEAGDVIKGTGGVRKMRWAGSGRGKRGGLRVIYYLRLQNGQIWLLTVYAKNVKDAIPASVLKKIKEELDGSY
jgi:mRNA-degrading endonuclease RelE of RelBE toxin-antitoxin system